MEDFDKKKQTAAKLFQYFMILVLFAAAALLPACEAGRRAAKTQGDAETADDAGMIDSADAKDDAGTIDAADAKDDAGTIDSAEAKDNADATDYTDAADTAETADGVNANRIVIDPGHGGFDSGMVGASGASEKELNLVYAKKLAALLEAEGYEAVLTRETEEGLYDADASNKKAQDMERRVARIAEENPILTVSIHQNSYPDDSSVKGPQVFYFEQSAEGEKLATAIQECLNTELAVERPRVQKGNTTYYILKRSVSTTVIVECGFLTNPEEEALLQEESYQDQVAQAICGGILEYLEG